MIQFIQSLHCNVDFWVNYLGSQEQYQESKDCLQWLQLLTKLLQEVINKVEEVGNRVFGFSSIDLGFLSSLWSLYTKKG